jgi:hypothetical protein
MKIIVSTLVALSVLACMPLSLVMPAWAHGWYPKECCHEMDCAPVERIVRLVPTASGLPQLIVTSKHGTAIIPHDYPVRESKDGRMHVCCGQIRGVPWT